ncbi:phosphate ABC transporter substrate-binding protein [Pseudomonas gingeri]|uniref:phosphate ABC transporter substrate-binding protein n=1 Tax=Pseudomonas gingeri TaxID=117681 RepID=UPI0015A49820|nr:phosphate ABC transporter substrate-binding protein [Pseudomonas gingeri]NWD67128.1 phosphate ABC transporter substrate-binding protein [Pseudomonas gingeri]NWD77507.1 phosphate ABC transporter substrate-binding protein [Pseudomonas gingeri]
MGFLKRAGCTVAGFALCMGSTLAMAEVVVVVAATSPVQALTRNQVADIFLGKTNRFPSGKQAIPIDQTEGSAPRDEFYTTFTGKSAAQLKAHWSKIIFTGRGQPPEALSNSAEVKKRIAGNPDSIGYIEAREVDASVRALPPDPP